MKSKTFNYSLLAVGVAALMGVSTGAHAAEAGAVVAGAAPIDNQATASYSVGNVPQPDAVSNIVTVNVSETSNFTLVSTVDDDSQGNDTAVNRTATPGGTTEFTHQLSNTGNVTDTYIVETTGNNDALDTASPNYQLGVDDIEYVIVDANGNTADASDLPAGQPVSGTITNNGSGSIQLPPGFKANLSYNAPTPDNRQGGDIGVGTLTATSNFNSQERELVNENQTIVRLPVFSVAKTATCGTATPCATLDLSQANPTIDYSITVTNSSTAYSDTATNFIVRDVLPAGLTLNGNVTANGASISSDGRTPDGRTIIDVTVPSLAVGASQVISFTANVDKDVFNTANSSVTNQATVYDNFDNTAPVLDNTETPPATGYDIVDSTDDNTPALNDTNVPDEGNGNGTPGADTTTTISFTNRNLTLEKGTVREIAPLTSTTNTDGQVTHVATLTNLGQDVEGDANNPLTITISEGTNPNVNIVDDQFFFVYTSPGGQASALIPVTPTKNGDDYIISSTQFPGNTGIPQNGKLEIRYNVESVESNGTTAAIGDTEDTTVTLTAEGTNPPTVPAITDTTNVEGLTLLKEVALQADCTGSLTTYEGTLGSNSVASFTAKPGDCIYYQITAENTFTSISNTSIDNVVISDLTSQWNDGATYQPTTASSSNGGSTTVTIANAGAAAEAVTTDIGTLNAGTTGILTFATKVNP